MIPQFRVWLDSSVQELQPEPRRFCMEKCLTLGAFNALWLRRFCALAYLPGLVLRRCNGFLAKNHETHFLKLGCVHSAKARLDFVDESGVKC